MDYSQQDHLLADEPNLVQASKGKRFANYFVDAIVFYVIIFIFGMIYGLMAPDKIGALDSPLVNVISFVLFGLVMGGMEVVFKGKSIGKMVTGTRAVNQDGTPISSSTAFKRGFCRLVPFEAFSALGTPSFPWHDKWTDTYVIDEKESMIDKA